MLPGLTVRSFPATRPEKWCGEDTSRSGQGLAALDNPALLRLVRNTGMIHVYPGSFSLLYVFLCADIYSGKTLAMSTFLDDTDHMQNTSRSAKEQNLFPISARWRGLLFWAAVALLVLSAILMRLYHLNIPFDRDGYDEGVYWQSLRAMLSGQALYHPIFYSQPPFFLLSVYPFFASFGSSIWSARLGIAVISLLGLLGIALLGKALAGRIGVLAALLLLVSNFLYFSESQILQAEAPSVAFTLLAVGLAFLWWQQPGGWRGICWATLAGLTLALSILCKLLAVSTVVPIALLLLARVWQIWRKRPGTSGKDWLPMLLGIAAALLATLVIVLPFLGVFRDFWYGVVTFHTIAAKAVLDPRSAKYELLQPVILSCLSLAALYGLLVAGLRRDWRVVPLLAWLLVTGLLLVRQTPLLAHHMVALEPPLIALSLLGLVAPSFASSQPSRWRVSARILPLLAILLILLAAAVNVYQDISALRAAQRNLQSKYVQNTLLAAHDLQQAITADQWVVTDAQFIAGMADRDTPPALVDTSGVRVMTGSVTLAQLEQASADPRVHAVLFFTNRLEMPQLAGFHAWVAQHFHLLHSYGTGEELWVR